MINKIGKVSATERNPNSCDEFTFWLEDNVRVSPFDIVKVENNVGKFKSTSYGVIQDILHITDSPGHISNYVSSDFGDVDAPALTKKLALSYAKASIIHNSDENYMPVMDGSIVYTADEDDISKALGLDIISPDKAIPAGLLKTSNGVTVPIQYNGDFLIGPEGAHINISGISGLATKTSYIMFLLQAIQYKSEDIATIILNVKGDDLLRIDRPNTKITELQQSEWEKLGLPCKPFENVKYYYPYKSSIGNNDKGNSNTALNPEDLQEQFEYNYACNYVYTYDHDVDKIDLLFSNVDDPNYTIESIINYISSSREFEELTWDTFKGKLKEYTNTETKKGKNNQEITVQSWRKFSRLISNSINNDIFQNSLSGDRRRCQKHLSDEIANIEAGGTYVVDIAKLDEQLQCLVFGDIIKTVYDLKHGDRDKRTSDKPVPKRVVIFVDELNKYAPSNSPKNSPILNYLLEITERGRSEGVILFSAEQFKSVIHDRIKGNCSTHVYGRTNAIEISKPDYRYIPNVFSGMMNRLKKGDLIIQHPVFKTLLKIAFPYPSYHQGGEK